MNALSESVFSLPGGGALLAPEMRDGLDLTPATLQRWFEPQAYGDQAVKVGQGGRQAAWFVQGPFGQAVLRHYRRGGLVARFNESAYLWQGRERTRSWREFQVMSYLHHKGLAVPSVLAAAWWRSGPSYRAALMTRRLADVRPLCQVLGAACPEAVAREIVRMHQFQVWHADLNAYNILLDASGKVWLIDFDRARQGTLSRSLALGNLQRLRRSLRKVCGQAGDDWWQKLFFFYSQQMQF
ncbi:3-deoxy-D-manno-octulosonic acid kinase [Alcaligenes sp. SDU_A2]|uniref:3-deoxy-D-manno-octulosonic acid kinase n=1 Tax=Alcaligenes sp. SDU_A2 TaxID=3136634 RepID=UPI00311FAC96